MMQARSNLEQRITRQLNGLSPEDLQRIAEDVATILFCDRFPHLDARALSEEGRSRPGWPDAWVNQHGKIHGVEATVNKEKAAVIKHLKEDLAKAKLNDGMRGLLFVSGHSAVSLSADELTNWQQRFINEGNLEWVELIFASRLVRELAQPNFIRTRVEILSLDEHPSYFELVRSTSLPDEGRLHPTFIPTPEDYKKGRVHRPAAADQVLAQLSHNGCALVRGIGASGKSVLGWLLAREAAEQRRPAYWLDLAAFDDSGSTPGIPNALHRDLSSFGDPQSLFILDNIHLNEALAKSCVDYWHELSSNCRPRLLLLSRELQTSRGSMLKSYKGIEPIILKARQPEVLGVYRRLVSRERGAPPQHEPADEDLDQWVATFGGDPKSMETTTDLIAFSAAATRRLPQLLQGNWKLTEEDAIDEIRDVYLSRVSDAELANLKRLCVMQELDLALNECALKQNYRQAGFQESSRRGFVFRYEVGQQPRFVRFRFAHAALSRLFLKAFHELLDTDAERLFIAQQHAFSGVALVSRFVYQGDFLQAKALADQILSDPNWPATLANLGYISSFLKNAYQAGVVPTTSLLDNFCTLASRPALAAAALKTPLNFLTQSLDFFSEHKMSAVVQAVVAVLTHSDYRHEFAVKASQEPLDSLKNFLSFARQRKELLLLFQTVSEDLAHPDPLKQLVDGAYRSPFEHLVNLLEYTSDTAELKAVHQSLVKSLIACLDQPENLTLLVERALRSPAQHFSYFLEYTSQTSELMTVHQSLTDRLSEPDNLTRLAHSLESQQLCHVFAALRSEAATELWQAAFQAINLGRWNQTRQQEERPNIDAFAKFQKLAAHWKRPELSCVPALRLLRGSDPKEWQRPGVHLGQLSHVIRLAKQVRLPKQVTPAELDHFLNCIATPEWLDALFKSEKTGGLAGSLQALSDNLTPEQWVRFDRESLKLRIVREFEAQGPPELLDYAFSLLGAAAAMNIRAPLERIRWPTEQLLQQRVVKRAPEANRPNIGPLQIQFWLGVREMARARPDHFAVPTEQAEEILRLWSASREGPAEFELPAHVLQLNASVIAWLKRSQAAAWRLQAP